MLNLLTENFSFGNLGIYCILVTVYTHGAFRILSTNKSIKGHIYTQVSGNQRLIRIFSRMNKP